MIKETHRGVLLQAEALGKSFGARRVVDELSFTLNAGEILGFLGANGAGKSTTLRMLLSLVRPDAGSFMLLGESFPGGSRRVLGEVGALIERADLYPHLSARANLRMLGRLQGLRDEARIDEILEVVKLGQRADEPVRVFSQGMKQRLGLAQAILHRPRVLILDEPMTGLDPAGMRCMREWIQRLAADEGMAVLFSSHLLSEVEQLADRVLVLHAGRKVAEGRPAELFDRMGGARWELHGDEPARMASLLKQHCPDVLDLRQEAWGLSFRAPQFPASAFLHTLVEADCAPEQMKRADSLEALLLQLSGEEAAC